MVYVLLAYLTYPVVYLLTRSKRRDGSVLVFQTAKVGDMVCTTPVFREIKRALPPGARLGVVVDPVTRPLLGHNPHVDEMIEFDRKLYRGVAGKLRFASLLRRKRFARALILLPNTANILASFWAMIPERVSVEPDFSGLTLKLLMPLNTSVERHTHGRMSLETYLEALKHLRIEARDRSKEVYASPGAERKARGFLDGAPPRVGLVLGTGNELKDWGRENFSLLAKRIVEETKGTVILLGSGKDSAAGEHIVNSVGGGGVKNTCGLISLSEAPALIKGLSAVVGVDTGPLYMADALGVPVVDIAGPSDMEDQRPTGEFACVIQRKDLPCVPCSHTFKTPYACRLANRECVTGISVEEAFSALLKTLRKAGDGHIRKD